MAGQMYQSGEREKVTLDTDRKRKTRDIYSALNCPHLLDVGCGDGRLAKELGRVCGAEEIFGVDVSEEGIRRARQRGLTAERIDLDEEPLPFETEAFDSVHSGEVVHYLRDTDNFFREVRRCLKPGGVFVFTSPNLASIYNRIALLFGRLPYPMRATHDLLSGDDEFPILSKRYSLHTYDSMRRLVRRYGFEVLDTVGAHSFRSSVLVRAIETVVAKVPSLSYRNIFVCRKRV